MKLEILSIFFFVGMTQGRVGEKVDSRNLLNGGGERRMMKGGFNFKVPAPPPPTPSPTHRFLNEWEYCSDEMEQICSPGYHCDLNVCMTDVNRCDDVTDCTFENVCLNGFCSVAKKNQEPCNNADECLPGFKCGKPSFTDSVNKCHRTLDNHCFNDDGCAYKCNTETNKCIKRAAEVCTKHNHCRDFFGEDFYCNLSNEECKPKKTQGAMCVESYECEAGNTCEHIGHAMMGTERCVMNFDTNVLTTHFEQAKSLNHGRVKGLVEGMTSFSMDHSVSQWNDQNEDLSRGIQHFVSWMYRETDYFSNNDHFDLVPFIQPLKDMITGDSAIAMVHLVAGKEDDSSFLMGSDKWNDFLSNVSPISIYSMLQKSALFKLNDTPFRVRESGLGTDFAWGEVEKLHFNVEEALQPIQYKREAAFMEIIGAIPVEYIVRVGEIFELPALSGSFHEDNGGLHFMYMYTQEHGVENAKFLIDLAVHLYDSEGITVYDEIVQSWGFSLEDLELIPIVKKRFFKNQDFNVNNANNWRHDVSINMFDMMNPNHAGLMNKEHRCGLSRHTFEDTTPISDNECLEMDYNSARAYMWFHQTTYGDFARNSFDEMDPWDKMKHKELQETYMANVLLFDQARNRILQLITLTHMNMITQTHLAENGINREQFGLMLQTLENNWMQKGVSLMYGRGRDYDWAPIYLAVGVGEVVLTSVITLGLATPLAMLTKSLEKMRYIGSVIRFGSKVSSNISNFWSKLAMNQVSKAKAAKQLSALGKSKTFTHILTKQLSKGARKFRSNLSPVKKPPVNAFQRAGVKLSQKKATEQAAKLTAEQVLKEAADQAVTRAAREAFVTSRKVYVTMNDDLVRVTTRHLKDPNFWDDFVLNPATLKLQSNVIVRKANSWADVFVSVIKSMTINMAIYGTGALASRDNLRGLPGMFVRTHEGMQKMLHAIQQARSVMNDFDIDGEANTIDSMMGFMGSVSGFVEDTMSSIEQSSELGEARQYFTSDDGSIMTEIPNDVSTEYLMDQINDYHELYAMSQQYLPQEASDKFGEDLQAFNSRLLSLQVSFEPEKKQSQNKCFYYSPPLVGSKHLYGQNTLNGARLIAEFYALVFKTQGYVASYTDLLNSKFSYFPDEITSVLPSAMFSNAFAVNIMPSEKNTIETGVEKCELSDCMDQYEDLLENHSAFFHRTSLSQDTTPFDVAWQGASFVGSIDAMSECELYEIADYNFNTKTWGERKGYELDEKKSPEGQFN